MNFIISIVNAAEKIVSLYFQPLIKMDTVVGLVLEMEYLQMLTFIQTYRKNFEIKVLTTSWWGTVETLKHDCLTDDVEFGDFPIFRFQINYGLCASSLRMSTKLEISTGGNFQTHL